MRESKLWINTRDLGSPRYSVEKEGNSKGTLEKKL